MKIGLLKLAGILGIRNSITRMVINRRSQKLYGFFIKQNDLVFDIGANIGSRTAFFSELGARVICVEPQKKCVQILKNKFAKNGNVTIVPKGISDSEGTMELYTSEQSSVIATMSEQWKEEGRFSGNTKWNTSQTVEVTTLDLLISKYGIPVFCKIDVEGFEKKVISGLSKKIPVISFEFTSEFFQDALDCIKSLNSMGSIKLNYSLGESMLFQNPDFIAVEECINQIKKSKDELAWGDIYVKFID